jgi:predicted nuclease of predicted toxin-antitoxin system
VLISADTDFGMLLSHEHASTPSVILVRRLVGRRAKEIADVVLANLDTVRDDIEAGAIVVLGEDFVRIRPLPI